MGGSARRVVRAVLSHVNVVLAMFAGCMALTSARLWLDPTLYAVPRWLWPAETRAVSLALPAAAALQLSLVHLLRANKRAICAFAAGMAILLALEAGAALWLAAAARAWLQSPRAAALARALALAREAARLLPALGAEPDWLPAWLLGEDALAGLRRDVRAAGRLALAGAALCVATQLLALSLAVTLRALPRSAPTRATLYYKPVFSLPNDTAPRTISI